MYNKNIGFTIGKFAPLHKGHQLLIETALKEMDEVYVVVYDTDIIDINVEKRANWIKQLYPNIHIIYAYDSPKQYGLDKESVKIQMNYLSELIKDIPVTHFYSSELYGEKVAEYLNIENRMIDLERKMIPVSSSLIREDCENNSKYMEKFKELSKITITNITKDCGVNRQTFYYHFKDVYDLLEWIYMNEVIQSMEGNDTYDTWQQGFLSIFEYVLENKEFVKNTYYSISRDFFLRFIYKQTTVLLMNIIDEKSKGMKVRREDKQFMADFYKYGFVGIMQDWIESGMKEKPDNIIKKLNSIIEGNFENALEKLKCSN